MGGASPALGGAGAALGWGLSWLGAMAGDWEAGWGGGPDHHRRPKSSTILSSLGRLKFRAALNIVPGTMALHHI